jgi:acyl-CoA reductase-like NAD-dependent aldehyde dehydrogenase
LQEFLADAHAHGSVIAGGAPLDRDGFFIAPTIVKDIPDSARLVRDEQFGPILPILPYDSIDDVIARTNDSEYGLGGTIWTSNPERGIEVALKIDSGTIWINKHLDLPFDVPLAAPSNRALGQNWVAKGLRSLPSPRSSTPRYKLKDPHGDDYRRRTGCSHPNKGWGRTSVRPARRAYRYDFSSLSRS